MAIIPQYKFAVTDGLDDSYLPVRGDSYATGWDVRAADNITFSPLETIKIPLGLRCFAPPGWWLELRPRSSTFTKKNLSALYGVIDESYAGELLFACQWNPSVLKINKRMKFGIETNLWEENQLKIEKGERIGQLIPVRRQEMEIQRISNEEFEKLCQQRGCERGTGGFGSTGS